MSSFIEFDRALVPALRTSEALPNTTDHGQGDLHILFGEKERPIGYLVRKACVDDAWESLDPRYFVTTSHAVALHLLSTPYRELPSEVRAEPAAAETA